ncbi:MAG TPA: FG-GAP repeat protein [Terriglobales bacterium]|nr:FG-GAP repeat protein [Terriglobales bacterium]
MAVFLAGTWCFAFSQVRQLAELTASDGIGFDAFGSAVAASGNTVVVGAPRPDVGGPGAAYVFVKSANSWPQAAELVGNGTYEEFGYSVAISSGTIVVGAPHSGSAAHPGAVYVFVEPPGGWSSQPPTAVLKAPTSPDEAVLGDSVSIGADGTTIIAGAEGIGGPGTGAVYVFEKPAGGWVDTSEPTATLSSTAAWALGNAVAISSDGSTVVSGSIGQDQKGVAYVFTKPQGGWQSEGPVAALAGSDESFVDAFATAVAIDAKGDTVAVGSPGHGSAGTAYVFVRPVGGWQNAAQNAELTVSSQTHLGLGASLVATKGLILAGASGAFIGHQRIGAVFGYIEPPHGWANTSQPRGSVTSSDGESGDGFGWAVALSGNLAVVGAPGHEVNGNVQQGAAYVFGP